MSRQAQGYYELLELVERKHPDKAFLKPREVAELLGCNIKTVMAAINKKYNPLPARNVGGGIKNKSYLVPVTEFCRWAITGR